MSEEILIVQCLVPLKPQKLDTLREQILKQKETGVILLPYYCTAITKPKDVDIQVKKKKEDPACPCLDCKYFSKEGMGHCTIHPDCYGDSICDDFDIVQFIWSNP